MVAQGLAVSGGYAGAVVWRGLLLLRAMGIGVTAGLVAGFVAGGIGSRLAMKVVALIAGPDAQGRITENGSTIGAFTSETLFLLFFGATLGTFGGLLYMALRPWLPVAGRWRGLAYGAILLATGGGLIIEEANFDFTRFGIPLVNIALFAALYLGFGLLVAPVADGLDRRLPVFTADQVGQISTAARYGLVALGVLPVTLVLGAVVGVASVWMILGSLLIALCGLVALGLSLVPAGEARRGQWLGGFAFATVGGLFGCFLLVLFAAGFVLASDDERPAPRLVGACMLLLIVAGFGGRRWLASADGYEGRPRTALLLAVPVLAGLGVTLREIGMIMFGA